MNKYTYLFKYIIIGDASVGKSCLLLQFLESKFKTQSQTTVGVEFGSKTFDLSNDKIKLQVWDTSITRSYYRGSIGAILVYDITCKKSFKNLEKWLDETKSFANEKLSVILVGNKNDLEQERKITYDQGKRFAQEHNMLFVECSAKNYELTESIFIKLAAQIVNKINNKIVDPKNESLGVKIGNFKNQENSGPLSQRGYCC